MMESTLTERQFAKTTSSVSRTLPEKGCLGQEIGICLKRT